MTSKVEAEIVDITLRNATNEKKYDWIVLEPKYGSVDLPSFIFPKFEDATYTIGSLPENDFILPASIDKPIPTSTLLTFTDGSISVEKKNFSAKIENSRFVDVKFGDLIYTLNHTKPNAEFCQTWFSFGKCLFCRRYMTKSLGRLICGHSACGNCLTAILDHEVERKLHYGLPVHFDLLKVDCPKCFTRNSFNDLTSTTTHPNTRPTTRPSVFDSLETALFGVLKRNLEICSNCQTHRCSPLAPRDHYFCNTCSAIFCPLCVLESHRKHDLVQMYATLVNNFNRFLHEDLRMTVKFKKILPDFEASLVRWGNDVIMVSAAVEKIKARLEKLKSAVEPFAKLVATLNVRDVEYSKKVDALVVAMSSMKVLFQQLHSDFVLNINAIQRAVSLVVPLCSETTTKLKSIIP